MNYQKMSQQQQNCNVIPIDFIKSKRFKEIIGMLNENSSFSHRDRYVYGYALLWSGQYLQALLTFWPLILKGCPQLQEDCTIIVTHILSDKNFFIKLHDLPEKTLYTLAQIMQKLIPQSNMHIFIKQHLFDLLWQKRDYQQLERILKSTMQELSRVSLENLSKLCFFQAKTKLSGNITAFVAYILTGGACLISRNPTYHADLDDEINLLGYVLKDLFDSSEIKKQTRLYRDKVLFENIVNYETNVLIHVLRLAISSLEESYLDIIPTPGYLIHYDSSTKGIGGKFLSWLAKVNQELFEIYNPNVYCAVVWLFSSDELSKINSILQSTPNNKFNPYLRLAIMLRVASVKQKSLSNLVQINEFKNLNGSINVFRNVAIQTVHSIINNSSQTGITTAFWKILLEFYPVLQDPEINNILIKKTILALSEEYKEQKNLDLSIIKNIVQQTNHYDLANRIDFLCKRQQECLEFLSIIQSQNRSKQIIKRIKDQLDLRSHLTLIADSYLLVAGELSEKFFEHIETLVNNKVINKLIKLNDIFDFNCKCYECYQLLCNYSIPMMVEKLNLSVASIPDFVVLQQIATTKIPKRFILSDPDPFKLLDVNITDPKQIIMQKVMKLMQQAPHKMAIFRQAQSALFDPAKRFLHHYFRYLSHDKKKDSFYTTVSHVVDFPSCIPFRSEFLNEN